MRRVSDYSPRCRSAIACKSGIVGAVAANEFPYEWGFPRFVKVLAFVAVAGFALFAGDDDVTWGEFAWNIAFGTVGVVAIVVLLIRPRVRLDENGMVLVRNPIRSHRFDAWDILDYDWSFLGYMTIELGWTNDRGLGDSTRKGGEDRKLVCQSCRTLPRA